MISRKWYYCFSYSKGNKRKPTGLWLQLLLLLLGYCS